MRFVSDLFAVISNFIERRTSASYDDEPAPKGDPNTNPPKSKKRKSARLIHNINNKHLISPM